jgi:hypothetical protein
MALREPCGLSPGRDSRENGEIASGTPPPKSRSECRLAWGLVRECASRRDLGREASVYYFGHGNTPEDASTDSLQITLGRQIRSELESESVPERRDLVWRPKTYVFI